jgi:DNA-binding transcriptional regulator YdaS (Cro superfamily)
MKHGLSQAQAAALVGTVQRTWAQWELRATPEVDFCAAIERLTKGQVSVKDWVRSRRKLRKLDAERRAPKPVDQPLDCLDKAS